MTLKLKTNISYAIAGVAGLLGIWMWGGGWEPVLAAVFKASPCSQQFMTYVHEACSGLGSGWVLPCLFISATTLALTTHRRYIRCLCVGVMSIAASMFYWQMQPLIGLHEHQAWDGTQYHAMYYWFKNGVYPSLPEFGKITLVFPFAQRVGVPFIASLLPIADAVTCFRVVNIACITGFVMTMFYAWDRFCGIKVWIALVGLAYCVFHWAGPVRSLSFCTYSPDAPVYLFEALILCAILARRYTWLIIIAPIATLFKEHFNYVFIVLAGFVCVYNHVTRTRTYVVFPFIVATLLSLATSAVLTRWPFPGQGFGGFSVLYFCWRRLYDPITNVRWLAAMLTALSGFGMIGMFTWYKRVSAQDALLLSMTVLTLLFSYVGVTDMTRLVFLGFPFTMTLILMRIRHLHWTTAGVAGLVSIPVMRIMQNIPEPLLPLPNNDISGCYSWVMEYADLGLVNAWLAYFAATGLLLWVTTAWYKNEVK